MTLWLLEGRIRMSKATMDIAMSITMDIVQTSGNQSWTETGSQKYRKVEKTGFGFGDDADAKGDKGINMTIL